MGYVFGKAFWWILLALVLGAIIGYYWNGWRRKRWVDSSSTSSSFAGVGGGGDVATDETLRLRTRVAELRSDCETATARVAELEAELADCRAAAATPSDDTADDDTAGDDTADDDTADQDTAAEVATGMAPVQGFAALDDAGDVGGADPGYDLDAAAAAIGKKIKADDLKVVEGIGPKIEQLIHAGGITTWAGLAAAPIERLQEILDAAGERYRIHDPGTWPRQAGLLAEGRWEDFQQLTDDLTGGRE